MTAAGSLSPERSERSDRYVSCVLPMVLGSVFLGLVWKWRFFYFADSVYRLIVVRDSFFPAFLQEALTLRIAFLICLVATVLSILVMRWRVARTLLLAVALVAASILMVHQGSYNDMTFVTSWWCLVFSLWYSSRLGIDPAEQLLRKASLLSRVIVSVVLLGGAVGKWTAEYWSGQVLYEIYFLDRDFWTFNWLRQHLSAPRLRDFATVYSRFIILTESFGSLIWLLPPRLAAIAGVTVFLAIGLLSNYLLFSVLAPMIGLAAVGLFRLRRGPETRRCGCRFSDARLP